MPDDTGFSVTSGRQFLSPLGGGFTKSRRSRKPVTFIGRSVHITLALYDKRIIFRMLGRCSGRGEGPSWEGPLLTLGLPIVTRHRAQPSRSGFRWKPSGRRRSPAGCLPWSFVPRSPALGGAAQGERPADDCRIAEVTSRPPGRHVAAPGLEPS